MNDKIALYLVNGALGAGKTTLVDFLVQQPEFAHWRNALMKWQQLLASVSVAVAAKS